MRRLCRADEVSEGGARDFRFGSGGEVEALFVVRKGGALHAYVNSCPHIGTPLNLMPNRFFDREGKHLLCTTHGALFRPEDGFCVSGPCAGKNLTPIAIHVEDGEIMVAV